MKIAIKPRFWHSIGYLSKLCFLAKLKKCEFGKPCVKYLKHMVGSGGLREDQDKVAAVLDWEPPKDIKGI